MPDQKVQSGPAGNALRIGVAELLGTMFLVGGGMFAASTSPGSTTVALTFGVALGVLVYIFTDVSGAHFNPAVTIGLAFFGKVKWQMVPIYIAPQVMGAMLASKAIQLFYGEDGLAKVQLGATFPTSGVSEFKAFSLEATITFLLMAVVLAIQVAKSPELKAVGYIALAFVLTLGVQVAGPHTGGSANPARTLGPMIVLERYDGILAYMAGPITGAILAVLICGKLLFQPKKSLL